MRIALMCWLCVLTCGCIASMPAPQPSEYELSWAKRGVPYATFVADVDACNLTANAAGEAVPPHAGDPANDGSPPIMFWRWILRGYDVEDAMAQSYQDCFTPRGYRLIYVPVSEADALRNLPFEPIYSELPYPERRTRLRDDQLRILYAWAVAPNPRRARIETRLQRRHMVAQVMPTP